MLIPSWSASLQQTLKRLGNRPVPQRARIAILGIGQELRGDDAIGSLVARQLQARRPATSDGLVLDGGAAPESQTGPLRRFRPDVVILVDAAQMDAPAGAIRWLAWADTQGLSASTHTLPLHVLAYFLTLTLGCEVFLVGIQPADTTLAAEVSPAVRAAGEAVISALATYLWDSDIGEPNPRAPEALPLSQSLTAATGAVSDTRTDSF